MIKKDRKNKMGIQISKEKKLATEGYILDFMNLKPGDIVLERQHKTESNIIAKYTKSHYSHAMIYDGTTLMEATMDGGVFSKVPNRFFVVHEMDLKVLRLKKPIPSYAIEKIVSYAGEVVGSAYSVPEAMKAATILKVKPGDLKLLQKSCKRQFCSRLVAQCYERANILLVNNVQYCSPGDLERSDLLEEVQGLIFKASPEQMLHAQSGSFHSKHVINTVKWVKEAKKILKKSDREAETINEIFMEVIRLGNSKVDKLIRDEMISSGYTTDFKDDEYINPYRYNNDLFEEKLKNGSISIDAEIKKEIGIYKKYSKNYKILQGNYAEHPVNVLACELELSTNLLLTIKRRLSVITFCYYKLTPHSLLINQAIEISKEIDSFGI